MKTVIRQKFTVIAIRQMILQLRDKELFCYLLEECVNLLGLITQTSVETSLMEVIS